MVVLTDFAHGCGSDAQEQENQSRSKDRYLAVVIFTRSLATKQIPQRLSHYRISAHAGLAPFVQPYLHGRLVARPNKCAR